MEKGIRIRQTDRGIKVLDRAGIAAQHIKKTYTRTKDYEEREQSEENVSSTEYAENKMANTTAYVVEKAEYQAGRQGGSRSFPSVFSAGTQSRNLPLKGQSQKQGKAKAFPGQPVPVTLGQVRHAADRREKDTIKYAAKYAGKGIKTAEQAAHVTIKTTQEATKSAQAAANASAQAAKKSVWAARQAEEKARRLAYITVKAVKAIVKVILAATKAITTLLTAGGGAVVFLLLIVVLFGGILCTTGGSNSSSVSPVSAEVGSYEPLIRRYASQYGIGEYVELIKAVMMQESGGSGLDPMQSSEGAFNTLYPRQANGITDPEYSIECGVQELKAALEEAEVKSPVDMERIKLALQGYNFGNGYISWAKENYGGYSAMNAAEFSDRMAQKLGWEKYGDKQYVPHVLRYYAFGRIPGGTGNQTIVQVALAQEGNPGDTYWSWYGFSNRVEWCACFVSWCADQCGYIESGVMPKFSACMDGAAWFESRGQFQDGSYVPAAGDLVFFDWGNDGRIDHVGIVEGVSDGRVNTIEGNSGDRCARRNYAIGDGRIYGYGTQGY